MRRATFGSLAGAISGAASNSFASSVVNSACTRNAVPTCTQRRSTSAASASRHERSSATMVRATASRGDSADEGTELGSGSALRAVLLDRLDPCLAHPGDQREQLAHLLRV